MVSSKIKKLCCGNKQDGWAKKLMAINPSIMYFIDKSQIDYEYDILPGHGCYLYSHPPSVRTKYTSKPNEHFWLRYLIILPILKHYVLI